MNIEKTKLKEFIVPNEDNVSLWIAVKDDSPIFYVEFNSERVGNNKSNFAEADKIYSTVKRILSVQHDARYCDWCGEFIIGTKKYQIGEDKNYTEKLCPECHVRASKEYKSVTEVEG